MPKASASTPRPISGAISSDARRVDDQGPKGCGAPARRANLDGDPFVDAQDWDIADFDIAVTDAVNNAANATVKFRNSDTPTVVVLDLVKTGNDWRVGDVTWQHDGKKETLRGFTATDAQEAPRNWSG